MRRTYRFMLPRAEPSGSAGPRLVGDLERALLEAVRGEVRFDDGSRAMYSTDASNYRQIPLGVVLPKDARDVEAAIAACRRFDAPIVSRGGGTSLAGEACNEAVVFDFSKYMHGILAIDWERRTATVEPGCVTDDLRNVAEERRLTYGPDPATHSRNTLGGQIGNNSCGMHAQYAGKTEQNVEQLEIVTYDGLRIVVGPTSDEEYERIVAAGGRRAEIYAGLRALRDRYGDEIRARFPKIPRRVSGFGLDQLLPENGFNVARALVGTEGTCITIVSATVRLVDSPACRALLVLGFNDLAAAADFVPFCNEYHPLALEGMGESMFRFLQLKGESTEESRALFPAGAAWLVCEFGADTEEEAAALGRALQDASASQAAVAGSRLHTARDPQKQLWAFRDNALGSTSKIPNQPDYYPGWEDSAVDPLRLGEYLRVFQQKMHEYDYEGAMYGHFGHGCVHVSINFDLFSAEGIAKYRRFVTEMAHICVAHGGSLSGEHGDGQARGELLPIMYGDRLVEAFWEFKSLWDPGNKMNPGKVVRPHKLDENLRWGTSYEPWEPETHFTFARDHGSFAFAANRCVGTGKCRQRQSGTMCPSYMATREEAYSTRGRSRLLFEMLERNPLRDGWQNEAVKDALDLCLACKGCKSECPVNVDMATYKAEFLAHYYERKRRPRSAYAFGLMYWWARAASAAPGLVNALAQTPLLRDAGKAAAGMAAQRRIPLFAQQTFREWFERRTPRNLDRPRVILWPDTWNNHFHPSTAQAAVEVLEHAGFQVDIPRVQLCCGRPLYDYGMLGLAKSLLRGILDALRDDIRAGVCVVGLEPSCVSVFRDEMNDLLGPDEDAKRLQAQTFLLSEFLVEKVPGYVPPSLRRKALVHQHCHHKAVLNRASETSLLQKVGLDLDTPDTGCCGMAGAFGFEREHYDVSLERRRARALTRRAQSRQANAGSRRRLQLPRADRADHLTPGTPSRSGVEDGDRRTAARKRRHSALKRRQQRARATD